jgi:hypothetical protein
MVLTALVMKSSILSDITPCIPLKVNRLCLPPPFTLLSCMACSSTLKMEAICFSEMSVDFQLTSRRYIPKDRTVHQCIYVLTQEPGSNYREHIQNTTKIKQTEKKQNKLGLFKLNHKLPKIYPFTNCCSSRSTSS